MKSSIGNDDMAIFLSPSAVDGQLPSQAVVQYQLARGVEIHAVDKAREHDLLPGRWRREGQKDNVQAVQGSASRTDFQEVS